MSKIFTAQETARIIPSGANIIMCGQMSLLTPQKVLDAIEERFLSEGEPAGVSVMMPMRSGWKEEGRRRGVDSLAYKGLLRRIISSTYGNKYNPHLIELIRNNQVECYALPMGVIFHLIRAIAAGDKALISEVGIGTFVDPRQLGGRMNLAGKELLEITCFHGKEYIKYPSFPIDIAILRGTTADEAGNISMEEEPLTIGVLAMAMAAKNSGGKVIVQVKRITRKGALHPRMVEIPGVLVDAVVVDPDQAQSLFPQHNPYISGEVQKPQFLFDPFPFNERKVILNAAVTRFNGDKIINLGYGVTSSAPAVAIEKGVFDSVTFFLEHGLIGGIPAEEKIFGTHYNMQALIDSVDVFNFFHGSGLDVTYLGFSEIDCFGNVNVSYFNGIYRGPGGFIDIVHNTKRILFCGPFSTKGLRVSIRDGKLNILTEGKCKKFVPEVKQICFNGKVGFAKGQDVTYITERAIFKLCEEGLELLEYAPGVDVKKDILDQLGFEVRISPDLKTMDERFFEDRG